MNGAVAGGRNLGTCSERMSASTGPSDESIKGTSLTGNGCKAIGARSPMGGIGECEHPPS